MPSLAKIKYPNIEYCEDKNEECICKGCSNSCAPCKTRLALIYIRNNNITMEEYLKYSECYLLECERFNKKVN